MNYQDTLQWMFAQLPMYQRQGKTAFKKDLNNILQLSAHLGQPETQFKSIHIGGTNGKGSVSHLLASVFQEAGYKTGLYTSPHLKDFRERIRINGKMIRKNCVINFIKRNQAFLEEHKLSFFEMSVGMAFEYFAKKKVDIAIVEVGLGGRLDSTNILTPELSIITNISLDHTQMLGDTIEKIAFEKAGIIKKNTPLVIGKTDKIAIKIFEEKAREMQAEIHLSPHQKPAYQSGLNGIYQAENINTVLTALKVLEKKGYRFTTENIKNGLLHVQENTGLRGRWELLQDNPTVIADTAHNEAGIKQVVKQLKSLKYDNLHFVISMVNDKDIDKILGLLPQKATYYFSKAQIPRGLDAGVLQRKAQQHNLTGKIYPDIKTAYKNALHNAQKNDVIFIGGSTFTVAEVL